MVTVLGSGLLVGTALAVIIPEGVHALYEEGGHRMYICLVYYVYSLIFYVCTYWFIFSSYTLKLFKYFFTAEDN